MDLLLDGVCGIFVIDKIEKIDKSGSILYSDLVIENTSRTNTDTYCNTQYRNYASCFLVKVLLQLWQVLVCEEPNDLSNGLNIGHMTHV
jgi:hypothetical protein